MIYVWSGSSLKQTIGVHNEGFVGAIIWNSGKLYSGGKDGRVCITDTSTMQCERAIEFGVLPRAIDIHVETQKLIVGLKTGSIIECDLATDSMTTYIQGHNSGEIWGLDMEGGYVFTSGDDNQVKQWDPVTRKCVNTADVNQVDRRAKKNKASTLGTFADSKSARALAISCQGHLAVCANDGSMTIRSTSDFQTVITEIHDSNEWIECAEFSPDGSYLAVGSHDTNIYIYSSADWSLVGTCKKHNAALTCIDWSLDGQYIRSVCNAYELLFFNIPGCNQDPNGASNTTGVQWASHHCKFGWCVDGIFPSGTDGSHINGVDMSED